MWYVMQVRTGTEHRIQLQCKKRIPCEILEKCFIPQYEEKKRIGGKWNIEQKILFPGYVFVVTEKLEILQQYLRKVIGFTCLLGTGDDIVALSDKEVEFLTAFGGEEHIVKISEGIIENSKVIIQSGPLQGFEASIRKIDRHKRKAYLELEMFGRMQKIEVGLEIFEKS